MRSIPALVAWILLVSSCNRPPSGPDLVDILALRGPSAMGMIYLIDSPGSQNNQPIRIKILDEPMQVRSLMLRERPEFALLPLNMAAILYNKGLPYQVIGIPVWGTLYLFGTDTTVKDWPDLRGRRIYVMGRGATPDILFRYLLEKNGLDPDHDIAADYSFPTHIDLANAVIAGKAPLAVISEPMLSIAQSRNQDIKMILDLNLEWTKVQPSNPDMPQTALLARKDFIETHPNLISEITARFKQSIDSVNHYPAGAAELIVNHEIIPDSTVAVASIPRCNLVFITAKLAKPAIKNYLTVLLGFNPDAVGGHLPDEEFFYNK